MSPAGVLWRDATSVIGLAIIPALWWMFLNRLGDFGNGIPMVRDGSSGSSVEQDIIDGAMQDQARFPGAHRAAARFSIACMGFLLVFGNFFLPYVVIRWGWGYSA